MGHSKESKCLLNDLPRHTSQAHWRVLNNKPIENQLGLPLQDYLMPGEETKFHSTGGVRYGTKSYHVILTDKRLLLYAQRGLLFKNDEVITQRLEELQGIKYTEEGVISKKGIIRVEGKTRMDLEGSAKEMKALYQQMMQFL